MRAHLDGGLSTSATLARVNNEARLGFVERKRGKLEIPLSLAEGEQKISSGFVALTPCECKSRL